jgi:hypothetical protein
MNNKHLYALAGSLSLIGLLLFLYKALALGFPLQPSDVVQRWDLEARVHIVGSGGPAKIALSIPSSSGRALLVDERFISRGFGLSMKRAEGARKLVWSRRDGKGETALYYRATIQITDNASEPPPTEKAVAPAPVTLADSERIAAQALVDEVRAQSADTETLVVQLLKRLAQPGQDSNAQSLVGSRPDRLKASSIAVQLLGLVNLPARTAWGLQLYQERASLSALPWLQVFEAGQWHTFDPSTGDMGMPEDLVLLGYGDAPLLTYEGARSASVNWSVRHNEEGALTAALERGRILSREFIDFSLFSLPLETQQVYGVLLMIPLGAMLLVVLRNLVGIKAFGTFMPVLIALAFRETQLLWGIVLFMALVGLGLAVRFYLEQLKLLLVPRLASLLIVVVLMMALVTVITHKLGLERGLSVALFPMVIITMTIERMSIVWDERGAAEAMQQGLGSLLAAVLAYLLMFNRWTEHLVFVFPELLLILLAVTLLLGRYSGYRLLELRRFKALVKEDL